MVLRHLIRGIGHPNPHPRVRNEEAVPEELTSAMHPDGPGRAEDTHQDGAEGEEDDPCQATQDGVGGLNAVVIRRLRVLLREDESGCEIKKSSAFGINCSGGLFAWLNF